MTAAQDRYNSKERFPRTDRQGGIRLEPEDIVGRRFSRRLLGADSREVREFLAETAAELDRARAAVARAHAERDSLQNRLREVAGEVDRLRGQIAAAHEKLTFAAAHEGLAPEVDRLRQQIAAAEVRIAAYQAREDRAAQLAAERDHLQNRLKEVTAEVQRLREQAEAARSKIAVNQVRKNLVAQTAAERDALRRKLKDVTVEVQELRDQLTTARANIAAYQAEDREIAGTLLNAQKAADDLVSAARRQAEDMASMAAAEADAAILAARGAAAETLRKAQARAEDAVRAAEQAAAARLAQLAIDGEAIIEEAGRSAAESERTAELYVTGLIAQLETFISDGQFLLTLNHLGENLAGSLETLTRLQREAQDEILPALHLLVQKIRDRLPVPPRLDTAAIEEREVVPTFHRLVDALSGIVAQQASPPSPPPSTEEDVRVPSSDEAAPPETARDRVVPLGARGEIVVSPVRTHYRATKIAEAVSRVKGIRVARFQSLQGEAACIDVITDAGTLTGIDCTIIDGIPMEVVEATDARLVLRVARTLSQSIPS